MSWIFISYRRGDSIATAGRIRDRLVQEFGRENVFVDIDDIPPGQDFVRILEEKIAAARVLLAVIGPGWTWASDDNGNRRLDDPEDFVVLEIASALENAAVQVIPVLIDGAKMPDVRELPERMKPLARRNAIELRNSQFSHDADRLLQVIRGAVGDAGKRSPTVAIGLGIAALVLALGGYVAYPLIRQQQISSASPQPLVPPRNESIEAQRKSEPAALQPALAATDAAVTQLAATFAGANGRMRIGIRGGDRIPLGKDIVFEARSDVAGRLIVVDVNAAGEVTQIFPNRFLAGEVQMRVAAGESIVVPGPGYGFTGFRAVEPVGRGKLIAIVVPDDVPQVQLALVEAARVKGFEPVNQPAPYFDALIALATAGEKAVAGDWAISIGGYEIVR